MPSNLVATVLQNYISDWSGRIDQNEQRPSDYGALNLAKAQTQSPFTILDPQVETALENAFGRTVQVPVVNYKDVSIGNARTCALQTEGLTSALVTLTAVTYSFGFLSYPMQHYNNYIGYQAAINRLIEAGLQKLASTVDAGVVNLIETNKNQYFPQAVLDYYAETGDAFQVPQAEKNDLYNNIKSILATADFNSNNTDILTNHMQMASVRRLAAQGQGNAVNEGFQFFGYIWYPTNRVTNGGPTIESTLYALAPGQIAIKSANSPDARQGSRIHESKYWELFPNAPHLGMDLDVFYQAECADASAVQASGMSKFTQTKVESWQFAVDVYYIKAYNSDPANRYTGIFKFEVLA
jgi:hypothetical protein